MAKPTKEYSSNTKRQVTQYPGVYSRRAERLKGVMDTCFDISYKVDGKKVWEKVGWLSWGYSPKLAAQIRAERMRSMLHGLDLPKQKSKAPYFKDVAQRYLTWAKGNKTKEGMIERNRYEKHLKDRFDDKRLNEITSFDLERLKADLLKKGLAPATAKHCLVEVREIFNKANVWGLYKGENPIKGVKMPVLNNQRQRFLAYEEAALLLIELKKTSKQLHDMALLSFHSGLRAGEIFNLKGQDLDFENGLIHISDPKNESARTAFMTEDLKDMLGKRMPERPAELVFKDRIHGGKIESVSRTFRRTVSELKLNDGITDPRQKVTFHTLRHTFASWLAIQGTPILTISQLLGHKSLTMTQRYSHLSPDAKKKAVLSLENSFKEAIRNR